MKKHPALLFILFLCLSVFIILFLCLLPDKVFDPSKEPRAAEPFDISDLLYKPLKDGTLEITKYLGNSDDIILPSEHNGIQITSIGSYAFSENKNLKSITLPDGITTIGCRAFDSCISLTEIIIPDSVTAIEESAFYNCKSLAVIRIPDSVTRLEANPFTGCNQLDVILSPDHPTLTFSDGVLLTRDGTRLIAYTHSRINQSFTLPETVTEVGNRALAFTELTDITIPEGVKKSVNVLSNGVR